ncbi:AAA family ATPase [Acinetobacter courvalinii]|uniref:AAA family ATPase n=1 Tax=Acinetobacter courvalinii TaxID=280147 RepID=UPI00289917F8|nr:ATP-binding protein [Acinetobacter courvalinii]
MPINNFYYRGRKVPLTIPQLVNEESNCYTVIIGKNGIGKSSLLSEIINDQLHYMYEKKPYEFTEINSNNDPKIISISTSPFDKFPLRSWNKNTNYKYIGMRNGINTSSAINLISSAIKALFQRILKNNHQIELVRMFEILGFHPSLEIIVQPNFSNSKINKDDEFSFLPIERNYKRHEYFDILNISLKSKQANDSLEKATDDNLKKIQEALIFLEENPTSSNASSISLDFSLGGLIKSFYRNKFTDKFHLEHLNILLEYNLLKIIDVRLDKEDYEKISLRRASSGEQCMISLILGIAGHITNNSLIFIDEPEISLHPKWQEEFMPLLIEIFKAYKGCHFLIATHSPQIISQLNDNNCFITSLTENKAYPAKDFNNMSSDFQLAELFEAPGIKNEYITRLAFSLLSKLKTNKKINHELKSDLSKLISFKDNLDHNDPTIELIQSVQEVFNFYASH